MPCALPLQEAILAQSDVQLGRGAVAQQHQCRTWCTRIITRPARQKKSTHMLQTDASLATAVVSCPVYAGSCLLGQIRQATAVGGGMRCPSHGCEGALWDYASSLLTRAHTKGLISWSHGNQATLVRSISVLKFRQSTGCRQEFHCISARRPFWMGAPSKMGMHDLMRF